MSSDAFTDVPAILGGQPLFADPPTWPPEDAAVGEVLHRMAVDGSWGRYFGDHCDRLIERLREQHDCEHVVLCSSGRAAVELGLRGLGVTEEDEVAMAAYDFPANFDGITRVGATPLLVDVRAGDAQLDVDALSRCIGPQTKAIIASHLHGGLVDMPRLRELADEHHLSILEDACQASGAIVWQRPAGAWGDVGVLSFGGSKLLTAGRGGALLTNRADVAQRVRRHLRGDNHAYPLSEMQAAVLLPQLDKLAARHRQRAESAAHIRQTVDEVPGVAAFNVDESASSPAYYKLGLLYHPERFALLSRERFLTALQAEGLSIDVGFQSLADLHGSRRFRAGGDLVTAQTVSQSLIALHHPQLLAKSAYWSPLERCLRRIFDSAAQLTKSSQTENL